MTGQIPDRIIYKGEYLEMTSELLISNDHPQIKERELDIYVQSSACWRGYIGFWEIKKWATIPEWVCR